MSDPSYLVPVVGASVPASTVVTVSDTPAGAGEILTSTSTTTAEWQVPTAVPNTFGTIAVSGQSNVVADSTTDTLTLVAGTNITITTDASTDTITITSSASSLTGFTGASNTGFGQGAADSISGGVGQNTAVGTNALTTNSNGYYNTAIGNSALTTIDTGSSCTGVGTEALKNTTGTDNTAVGAFAGRIVSGGSSNTSIGSLSMSSTSTNGSNSNTAVGYETMIGVSNSGNTAYGAQALKSITNAVNNCAIGRQAGYAGTSITTGSANTLIGDSAQVNSASASHRSVIGNGAVGIVDNSVQLGASGESTIAGVGPLSTTATFGYIYIPTCAGAPTGVPTSVTGMAPLVIDTTNNKLYFYSGSWRLVTST